MDTKGNVVDINGALQVWTGYEKNTMVGQNIMKMPYLTPNSRLVAVKQLAKRLLGQKIEPYELSFINKAGEKKIGRIHAKLLKDERGKVYADLVLISDVTELTQKVDELERMNKMMVDRELKMVELKEEIEKLKEAKDS